jgi:hypothetical protein
MSESVFNVIQLGRQSAVATSVAATTVFPVDAGFLGFELDRASESPNEDFGSPSREMAGRSSTGVRWATASCPFVWRFQDGFHPLEMHVDTVSPSGAGPYVYTYAFDQASNLLSTALKPYTWEYGDPASTQDEWEATGVLASGLTLGFDALSAPGNSMWHGSLDLVALNRAPAAMTGSLTPPATLETMEGHLTTLNEGAVGTAFGSLAALTASLKQFELTSTVNAVGRAYGGATDVATAIGRSDKANVEFTALVAISATSKTDILDIYEVSGSIPTERRWRITITGSGTNVCTIDARVRFTAVDIGEHEGERLYAVKGVFVYDSTLASHGTIILTNSVSAIP